MKNFLFLTGLLIIIAFCSFIFGCKPNVDKEADSKKEEAINGLAKNDSILYSVHDAMKSHGLKGVSAAVFEDYKIVWTGTWGIKDVESGEPIDNNTAFSTASIAKPITATLFAILEEKGLINLKDPVSKYLKRWKLPESEFLNDTELTFEHLLSHTGGTTQHGFEDFYVGDTIPTLVQSLKGQIPNYDEEISFQWTPGTNWGYSGGGYVIAQMAVEDSLGKSLADLADEYLFKPMALKNTTLKQPNEIGFLTNVAMAHDENGEIVGTGLPITPQVAPSGLWSTPSDLATFVIEIQNALRNKDNTVISYKVAKRVTAIVTSKVLGGWSLGWERRYGFGNYDWFSHGGANTGIGGLTELSF
jgi:CubicO group peptidase (beta-lactamase class C family)